MRKLYMLPILTLVACSSAPSPASWTPAQTAYIELAIATAAINIAAQTEQNPSMPAADVADVQTAVSAFSNGVQAQIATLTAGGSITVQMQSAAVAGVGAAVSNLGAILASKPTATSNPTALAMAAGVSALESLPAVAGAVVAVNGGLQPDASTLAASVAALQAAAKAAMQ